MSGDEKIAIISKGTKVQIMDCSTKLEEDMKVEAK